MNYSNKQNSNTKTMPKHIAIIMDGNGRWAQKRKLPRERGHQKGLKVAKDIIKHCLEIGVENLTLFALSSENIYRPKEEVLLLFKLFKKTLTIEANKLKDYDICLKIIGDISVLDNTTKLIIKKAESLSSKNKSLNLYIAVNYGGRWDIIQATKKIAKKAKNNEIDTAKIDIDFFKKHTALAELPNVDLLIRTGGEIRISNFLLWDIAYSELFFTDIFWPEFKAKELDKAIINFNARNRKFGKITK